MDKKPTEEIRLILTGEYRQWIVTGTCHAKV